MEEKRWRSDSAHKRILLSQKVIRGSYKVVSCHTSRILVRSTMVLSSGSWLRQMDKLCKHWKVWEQGHIPTSHTHTSHDWRDVTEILPPDMKALPVPDYRPDRTPKPFRIPRTFESSLWSFGEWSNANLWDRRKLQENTVDDHREFNFYLCHFIRFL